jgi:hypothetical protein
MLSKMKMWRKKLAPEPCHAKVRRGCPAGNDQQLQQRLGSSVAEIAHVVSSEVWDVAWDSQLPQLALELLPMGSVPAT